MKSIFDITKRFLDMCVCQPYLIISCKLFKISRKVFMISWKLFIISWKDFLISYKNFFHDITKTFRDIKKTFHDIITSRINAKTACHTTMTGLKIIISESYKDLFWSAIFIEDLKCHFYWRKTFCQQYLQDR